ncbi:MAG: protein-L-isoaspartate(D-aspartate) O-methyltransferase [Kofleriaceae bacterium]
MGRVTSTWESQRQHMVSEHLRRRDIVDPAVLAAFSSVPRDAFVPESLLEHAYGDMPLPIGNGQTISQPYVVAMTVQALRLDGHERVLEIGTGSGYAAAILASLAREVVTVERIPELALAAAERLARLGVHNVHVHQGDGTLGWPIDAPYEAICVAAAAPKPPPALLAQLAIGGRLVIPHGDAENQRLVRITRKDAVTYAEEDLGNVRFVPLIGDQGWPVRRE